MTIKNLLLNGILSFFVVLSACTVKPLSQGESGSGGTGIGTGSVTASVFDCGGDVVQAGGLIDGNGRAVTGTLTFAQPSTFDVEFELRGSSAINVDLRVQEGADAASSTLVGSLTCGSSVIAVDGCWTYGSIPCSIDVSGQLSCNSGSGAAVNDFVDPVLVLEGFDYVNIPAVESSCRFDRIE